MRSHRSQALFVYGTLRDPAIQRALFKRQISGEPAVLYGWAVHRSESDDFLFIKPSPADRVHGQILRLSDSDLEIADAWEDMPLYHRERVQALAEAGVIEAWTYTRRTLRRFAHLLERT